MLSNTIGEIPNGADAMTKTGIDPKRRPQTLSVDEWIRLEKEIQSARVD